MENSASKINISNASRGRDEVYSVRGVKRRESAADSMINPKRRCTSDYSSRSTPRKVPQTNRGRPWRSPGQIFSDISSVIEGWNLEKAMLPNLDVPREWHDTMQKQIVTDILMAEEFELYADSKPTGPNRSKRNMTAIAHRYLVFRSPLVIHALRRYHNSIYQTQGFLLEITTGANRYSGTSNISRAALNITRLESRIPCWPTWDHIYKEGSDRARENPRGAEYFHYGYDSNCRGVLQMIILHICGTLGMVLTSLDSNSKLTEKEHARFIIGRAKPIYDVARSGEGIVSSMNYETTVDSMNEFKSEIWAPVVIDVLQVGKQFFESQMLNLPEEQRRRIGKTSTTVEPRADRLYYRAANQQRITPLELIQHFFGDNAKVIDFWATIISRVFQFVLRNGNGLYMEIVEQRRFNETYLEPCIGLLRTMYDLIFTSVTDNSCLFGMPIGSGREMYHNRFDAWAEGIMANLRKRPIRHMEVPELANCVEKERQGLVITEIQLLDRSTDIIPRNPAERREPILVSELSDETVDITETIETYAKDEKRRRQQHNKVQSGTGTGVTVLVVEDPPPGSLDDQGKCKCCRIDWSKLNGRVQILRCPTGVNNNTIQTAMDNAVVAAGKALHAELLSRQNSNQGEIQDGNKEDEDVETQHVQLKLPYVEGQPQQVEMDVRVLRHLTRIPSQLLFQGSSGGGYVLPSATRATQAVSSSPDILNDIFNTLIHATQTNGNNGTRRAIQFGQHDDEHRVDTEHVDVQDRETNSHTQDTGKLPESTITLQVDNDAVTPAIPETSVTEVLGTTQPQETGKVPESTITLQVDNDAVTPAIPKTAETELLENIQSQDTGKLPESTITLEDDNAEVPSAIPETAVTEVLGIVDLGSVNHINASSFSEIQEPEPLVPKDGQQVEFLAHNEESSQKEARNDAEEHHITYSVEGIDCLSQTYDATFLLVHWAKNGRFMHPNMDRTLTWADLNIICDKGPLQTSGNRRRDTSIVSTFSNVEEFRGNMALLSAQELYDTIMEVVNNSELWNSANWMSKSAMYGGDDEQNGIVQVSIRMAGEDRPIYTAHSFCVAHLYLEQTRQNQYGQQENYIITYSRRLVYISSVRQEDNDGEDVDEIVSFVIGNPQLSVEERYAQDLVQREKTDATRENRQHGLRFFLSFSDLKYAGPIMRTPEYLKVMKNLPSNMLSPLLGNASESNNLCQIVPFKNHQTVPSKTVTTFINNNCSDRYIRSYIRVLMRLQLGIVPDDTPYPYMQEKDYPTVPQYGQLCATLGALRVVEENMSLIEEKHYNSPFFCIVGPAGTGKSTTIMTIISSLLTRRNIVGQIVDIYDAIEHAKNEENHPAPANELGLPPENSFRALMVTETNNALIELENMLLDGLVLMPQENAMRIITPLYSKVAMKHEETHRRDQRLMRKYEVPEHFDTKYTGTVTMTTFGSLPKAFTGKQHSEFRQKSKQPQYDVVIIDEASQVDLRKLHWLLQHLTEQQNLKTIPTILFAGDNMQQQPVTTGPPSIYTDLAKRNIIDHFISRTGTVRSELGTIMHVNKPLCPWIMLNVQFRMKPLISTLSNAVSSRNVFDHQSVRDRKTPHVYYNYVQDTCYNFEPPKNGLLTSFQPGLHLSFPITIVNPYRSRTPVTSVMFPRDIPNLSSFLEAACVVRIVEYLFINTKYTSEDILIITPYTNQVSMIRKMLNERSYTQKKYLIRATKKSGDNKSMRLVDCKTVGSIQSNQRRCVIFSTVRHSRMGSGGAGIVGQRDTVYVAITRARDQLIIVGDMPHLKRFYPWNIVHSFVKANNYRELASAEELAQIEEDFSGNGEPPAPHAR